jgi:DNA mismatch endonuclease (patch repair protein)
MQAQRRRDTRPEVELRRLLHASGLRYRLHVPIPGTRRTIDIAFPLARVAVDVRGCWWHRCPEHATEARANGAWWASKLRDNVARDTDTADRLTAAGWTLVVVWEHEIAADAAARVAAALRDKREKRPDR